MAAKLNLDKLDLQIIHEMLHGDDVPYAELGKKLFVSGGTIHVRIKKLEEAGYIKRYVAILDKDKVGKGLIAFTSVQLREHTQSSLRTFEQKSVKIKEVMECYRLTGNFDFLLKIAIRDMKEYNDFLMNKLSTLPNIGSVQTYFVLSEGKSETAYPLDTALKA